MDDGEPQVTATNNQELSETCIEQLLSQYKVVMSSGTDADRVKAAVELAKGHLRDVPQDVLSGVIPILVECLRDDPLTDPHKALQIAAVHCLRKIATQGDGVGTLANEIGRSGAIQNMLRLLRIVSDDVFRSVSVKCLWVLVSLGNDCRVILAGNRGLEAVIGMLSRFRSDLSLERYLLEILSALAMLKEVQLYLNLANGLLYLIRATRSTCSAASRKRAAQAIGLLGFSKPSRRSLNMRGAIPALVKLFHDSEDTETKLIAANSLAVLSADILSIRVAGGAGAVNVYAEILAGEEPVGREIAVDAFCVLAVAESNAVEIADRMVRVLREGRDDAKPAAINVLSDIAFYRHTSPVLRNSGAIPILIRLLRDQGGQSEVRKAACHLVSLLCKEKRYRGAIVDAEAIPTLAGLLDQNESEDAKQSASGALQCLYKDPDHRRKVSEAVDVTSLIS